VDVAEALGIARRSQEHSYLDLTAPPREIRSGWYFQPRRGLTGVGGIVVNKATGRVLALGTAFGVERDLRFYDKGYQAERYDLVVVAVHNMDLAIEHLLAIELDLGDRGRDTSGSPISHRVEEALLRDRLADLPCGFENQHLYFRLEVLEQVEQDRSFDFTVVPLPIVSSGSE
jgi:hypothetical protein